MVSLEFFIDIIIPASKKNEYQESFLGGRDDWCVGLTTLLPSCADCLEMWKLEPSEPAQACTGIALLLP